MRAFLALLACITCVAVHANTLTLTASGLTVSITVTNGSLSESYSTAANPVATYGGPTLSVTPAATAVAWSSVAQGNNTLVVTGSVPSTSLTFTRTVSIAAATSAGSSPGFRVVHTITNTNTTSSATLGALDDWYSMAGASTAAATFAYSPSIKLNDATEVTPVWNFKTPAVMLERGPVFMALLANITGLTNDTLTATPPILDIFNDNASVPRLSYGVAHTVPHMTNVYRRTDTPVELAAGGEVSLDVLLVAADAPASTAAGPQGFTDVVSLAWELYGRPNLLASTDMQTNVKDSSLTDFSTYREYAWDVAAQGTFAAAACGSETCGTLASSLAPDTNHAGTDKDAWFTVLIQTLRTSLGMYAYGLETNNGTLQTQAKEVLNLALTAPQAQEFVFKSGPFPAVGYLDNTTAGGWGWLESSGYIGLCRMLPESKVPERCDQWYHAADNSWTAFWMIQFWVEDTSNTDVLHYCNKYAQFLDKIQRSTPSYDGIIPSYYIYNNTLDDFIYSDVFGTYSAEMPIHALFLLELYSQTSDTDVLATAMRCLDFVTQFTLKSRKWYTADLFFGPSNIELNATDAFTGQNPESNVGKLAAAFAYLKAYQVSKNTTYLSLGVSVLKYATLSQSVVTFPGFSINTLGGFTTQNTDAQWSDARGAYGADILLKYYTETGMIEFLERGVAALRASLAVSPYQNWAPDGAQNVPGPFTSFHAGLGSAAATLEFCYEQFGQGLIVTPLHQHVCIDGCTFSAVSSNSTAIVVDIESTFTYPRGFKLVVATSLSAMDLRMRVMSAATGAGFTALGGTLGLDRTPLFGDDDDDSTPYALVVNGHLLGTYTGSQLSEGVMVPSDAFPAPSAAASA